MNKWLLGLLVVGSLSAQDADKPADLKIFLVTTDPARGAHFKDFFAKHNIACTVSAYGDATAEQIDKHDMLMADTPEGGFREVGEAMKKANTRNFPRTTKPIFAIATLGYQVLYPYEIAIGRVKT